MKRHGTKDRKLPPAQENLIPIASVEERVMHGIRHDIDQRIVPRTQVLLLTTLLSLGIAKIIENTAHSQNALVLTIMIQNLAFIPMSFLFGMLVPTYMEAVKTKNIWLAETLPKHRERRWVRAVVIGQSTWRWDQRTLYVTKK